MKTNYTLEGTPNSPVLVFSNSLGSSLHMWDSVVPHLLPYFRVLRYDTRGHGASEITPEPYTIALLGQDVIDLLDSLEIQEACFCGLSMGGLIGQWLAIHHPERITKLILSNTDSKIGTSKAWNDRIKTITEKGFEEIIASTLEKWFSPGFRTAHPEVVATVKEVFLTNSRLGYSNCCAAIRDADFRESVKNIKLETLVITGDNDPVTTAAAAQELGRLIPKATVNILQARHLASTELPDEYAKILINFIVGSSTIERGMHVRKTVLGNEHVDRATRNKNDFNTDFQEFISHYAWGEIWTRPGLPKHQRSLITLAMLIPLNKKAEFKMHVKAAFHNGVTVNEIKEVILQSGIYCGLPAANDAMHAAEDVFNDLGLKYK